MPALAQAKQTLGITWDRVTTAAKDPSKAPQVVADTVKDAGKAAQTVGQQVVDDVTHMGQQIRKEAQRFSLIGRHESMSNTYLITAWIAVALLSVIESVNGLSRTLSWELVLHSPIAMESTTAQQPRGRQYASWSGL